MYSNTDVFSRRLVLKTASCSKVEEHCSRVVSRMKGQATDDWNDTALKCDQLQEEDIGSTLKEKEGDC